MLLKSVAACAFGLSSRLAYRKLAVVRCESAAPRTPENDPTNDATTASNAVTAPDATAAEVTGPGCRCVVVGGGYAGSRIAYQLDSIFDVTLIDDKNFFEYKPDVIPLVCSPWSVKHDEALSEMHALHRFYLKRANVVTDRVVAVEETEVKTATGKQIPFDILIMATGETASYPFHSQCRTLAQREEELRHFNAFVQKDCHKIAIVGGGVTGTATAFELAHNYPDKQIDLFHNGPHVMPNLPFGARTHAMELLKTKPNLNVYLSNRVQAVEPATFTEKSEGSWWSKKKVTREPKTFDLTVERRKNVDVKRTSIFLQVLFQPAGNKGEVMSTAGEVEGVETHRGYDYVFVCSGNTPREDACSQSPMFIQHKDRNGRFVVSKYLQMFGRPNVLSIGKCNALPWVRSTGNSDMQCRTVFRNLLAMVSQHEANKAATTTASTSVQGSSTGAGFLQTNAAVNSKKMAFPRLIVRMGQHDAVGSTAWAGTILGPPALKELHQDRQFFLREFNKPVFFKARDPAKAKEAFELWRQYDATDVADFVID